MENQRIPLRLAAVVFAVMFLSIENSAEGAQPSPNKITSLPNMTVTPSFEMYTGYINVNATAGRALFYWFAYSQNDPSTDPLVLWLQGGPGCSGLIGFFQENGPLRIVPNTSSPGQVDVVVNSESWNRKANVLYIEAPAGVGFSYSNTSSDYNTNDFKTANDNYNFLLGFYSVFPQFATNDLWVTGESYAGNYGPELVLRILEGPDAQLRSNLKGFMLGNPVLSCPLWKANHMTVEVDDFYYHGLASYNDRKRWYDMGCEAAIPLTEEDQSRDFHHLLMSDAEREKYYLHQAKSQRSTQAECEEMYAEIYASVGPLDPDNVYTDFCTGNATLNAGDEVYECISIQDRTYNYLNDPAVVSAIGAISGVEWLSCTNGNSQLNYTAWWQNMLPYYEYFFKVAPNLRIMIYSGDVDIATCPNPYTQECLAGLKRPIVEKWRRWTIPGPTLSPPSYSNITAGFCEVYDTLSFCTVKGAGHEVPQYQPWFAYTLFERFVINGQTP